jgi:glycosyltransferase involved in cell wall biosynthesis
MLAHTPRSPNFLASSVLVMGDDVSGITVLIATYNRAAILSQTLEAFTCVDQTGIDCSIVIIDNNSSDNTREVVKEYEIRLPVSYLREPRPGKNCALNKALRECTLEDIVVFSDDDVTPARNWFQEIVSSTRKWPEIAVFGGKIDVLWPDNEQPEWVTSDWIKALGFSHHHYAEGEAFYKPPACPFGPNFWVKKLVFQKVPFFNEAIGPRPTNRIMGSETSFLGELQRRGFQMLHYPGAEVQHRVDRKQCRVPELRRRGYRFGRGQVLLYGWHRRNLYSKNKTLWSIALSADYLYTSLRFLVGCGLKDSRRNCEMTVKAMIRFGQLRETANQVFESFKRNGSSSVEVISVAAATYGVASAHLP